MSTVPNAAPGRGTTRMWRPAMAAHLPAGVRWTPSVGVAAIAAETGARFTRERIEAAPIEWLASPKRLLCGRTPLDACRTPEGFMRVAVLHGLSLGLDAPPEVVDGLSLKDHSDDDFGIAPSSPPEGRDGIARLRDRPDLYTATIVHADERGVVYIYAAMIATSAGEVRRRLRARIGGLLEDAAEVRLGFDPSEPLACAMVSDAMADTLSLAAAAPASPIAAGLDIQVEQRFAG